jgi:hypothetical protein
MGTLHEALQAFLCSEVTGWGIPGWGIPGHSQYSKVGEFQHGNAQGNRKFPSHSQQHNNCLLLAILFMAYITMPSIAMTT